MNHRSTSLWMTLLLVVALAALVGCSCLCSKEKLPAPVASLPPPVPTAIKPGEPWHFAVSGDSRNCGDVVMPAIAQGAKDNDAQFYWHLGDLRAIYDFDQDMQQISKRRGEHLTISQYESTAWDDFKKNQTVPFGGIPFFLGIGNHETIDPKNRQAFTDAFPEYLDTKEIRDQRLKDNPKSLLARTYFHWIRDGVDFIYLDNASKDQFDADQMNWLEKVVFANDTKDASIHTVIVGMHAALPNSISAGHSMNEWPSGITSGTKVYQDLLDLQTKAHKTVYILASHSHFYMEDTFNTQYWRTNGGVLPGWIVGTAGAERYALPEPNSAKVAKTNVYGYLLGTVNPANQPPGTVTFEFKQFAEKDIPAATMHGYGEEFVHWCFENNSKAKDNTVPWEH